MADNDVDAIYSTQPQIDFARRMAESLLKGGNYVPDAAMAKLPGTWMYGVPNIIKAISGAQYRDIAGGQQEKLAAGITGRQPNQVNRYGSRISQPNPNNAPAETKISSLNPGQPQQGPRDDFIHKLVTIESGGNPNARTGSYRGLGQFGPAEEKRYGINDSNWNDPQVATNAIKQHMDWLTPQLTEKLGRPPTDGELYLAHQQGVAGGPALLNNPDMPAWKAIRPYYKSDEMAKLAISGNIPRGNYLKSIPIDEVKASDFAKLWTSRFDSQEQLPKSVAGDNPIVGANAPPVNVPGKMGLGGPMPGGPMPGQTPMPGGGPQPNAGAPPGAPPAQLAQAQGIPQVPNANPQISPGNNIGGFGIPPANPAYHPQQLDALIRSADPKDYPKIINDYFKQLQGTQREDILGGTDVRPSGVPGVPDVVTHMAPKQGIPLGVGPLNLQMVPKPNGTLDLLLPGGATKNFSNVTDMWNYVQNMEAQGHEKTARAGAQAARYEADQQHAEANYRPTRDRGDQLSLAAEIANDPTFISGTAQQRRELISKFFQSVGMQPPGEGADITQAFVKLISGNILEDIKGLGGQGLGQVRAKEMEIIERMNAMPDMSPGAIRAVVNLTKKMNERTQDFQDRLLDYSANHGGHIDAGFYQEMRKHYNKNHFLSDDEIRNYREMFKPPAKEVPWENAPLGAKRRKIE